MWCGAMMQNGVMWGGVGRCGAVRCGAMLRDDTGRCGGGARVGWCVVVRRDAGLCKILCGVGRGAG